MAKLRVLDLFSGIGGFSLGLERTGGFETVAFCEIEEFPRRVLAKHWPKVPCYHDVRELTGARLATDGIAVDVICGGFPCQDISSAGKGAGLAGERSGLWSEIVRLAGELRPQFVIVENVAALLGRGLDRVLGDLAALGYDAEWDCVPASALGARHRRDRIWILAYANSAQRGQECGPRDGLEIGPHGVPQRQEGAGRFSPSRQEMANPECRGLEGRHVERTRPTAILATAYSRHRRGGEFGAPWRVEPDVGRVAYGVPDGMDRLKGLGNAVVPQIPELIGHSILASLASSQSEVAA